MQNYTAMTRRELTFAACDDLAAAGRKPSVNLVRERTIALAGIKRGSDGDVQTDISEWFNALFALKRDMAIDGLPESMTTQFRAVWRGAVEQAEVGLSRERELLAEERAAGTVEVERARGIAADLRHRLELADKAILAREETIARLDGAIGQAEAMVVQLNARLGAKDERIDALSAELARKTAEQAAAFTELDGARRHALLQIDQARSEGRHWKEQCDILSQEARSSRTAADTYRGKAGELEAALAGANARLDEVRQNLTEAHVELRRLEEVNASKGQRGGKNPRALRVPKRIRLR